MRRHLLAVTACLALLAVACGDDDAATDDGADAGATTVADQGTTQPPTSATAGTDGSAGALDQAAIDAAADAFLQSQAAQGVTALYVAISDPAAGDFAAAYGQASVDGPAASVEDNFRIGSITKTFTATVVLQLIESGDLALDDTVGDLLPDLGAEHPEIAGLTVEQLLAMQSGISDYLNLVDTVVPVIVEDPTTVWEPEDLIAAGVDAGVAEPGTAGYSTTNYLILQLIAESVTGSSLQDLIDQDVAEPLALEDTFLPPDDDTTLPDPATHGYVDGGCIDELLASGATVEPGTDTTDWNASYGQGGGGMTSTIDGLLGWAASGSGNDLLDEATVAERLTFEPLPEGVPYGLGILQIGSWIGHEGEAIGWEALAILDPSTGTAVALAANGCGGLFSGFVDVLAALYPDSL